MGVVRAAEGGVSGIVERAVGYAEMADELDFRKRRMSSL